MLLWTTEESLGVGDEEGKWGGATREGKGWWSGEAFMKARFARSVRAPSILWSRRRRSFAEAFREREKTAGAKIHGALPR